MFLKEIELLNFKCHRHLYLSFDTNDAKAPTRKTTFLLGENGTGKSALLKAIALVTAGSSAIGDLLSVPDEWVNAHEEHCEIRATLETAEGNERKVTLRFDRGASLRQIISGNNETLELIDQAIEHADRNYFVLGYGASRKLNKGADPSYAKRQFFSPRSENIQSLFSPDATLASLTNWAISLDYGEKGDGVETVRKALDAFLVEDVRFKEIDRQRGQLMFETPDGVMPLDQLSDGYQNVAAWVGDMMYRITNTFSDYTDPLNVRGLLLIDEIDLHLHPKWQRYLHAFLSAKLPRFQVVATTHSPLTAQQAGEGELYGLRRVPEGIELIPFRGSPRKMLLHQILMSPVFGIDSDESLEIEEAKSIAREFSLKGDEESIPSEVVETLKDASVNVRSNSLLNEDDLDLLRSINEELRSSSKL